ncbi:MAG: cell division protein ZapA [Clostridiales Family XIII bacterium]|jgi:cell division protein ZapA|nr:cell division protein ZapA [Clostridiales Family XIII bacterium]
MSGANRVNVKIFKREYTVSGSKPRDRIVKVADYVDSAMTNISEQASAISLSSLAVLTAVNIADDLFAAREEIESEESEKEQLQKDIEHYIQLWEEAKRNFLQNKEDSQAFADRMTDVQEKLNEKAIENDRLLKAAAEKDKRITELEDEKAKAIAEIVEKYDRKTEDIAAAQDATIEKLTIEGERRVASVAEEKDARIEELTRERNQRVAAIAAEKDARIDELTRERNQRIASITAEKDARIEELGGQVVELSAKLKGRGDGSGVSSDKFRDLTDKYKELEGNYFEIQMENIRLKGEIERLNSIVSEQAG